MKPREISKPFSKQVDRAAPKSGQDVKRIIRLKMKKKMQQSRFEVSEEEFSKLKGHRCN